MGIPMIASAGAAAAAAARALALQEEEERLAAYTPEQLAQGWEFKILRANTAAFRNTAVMQQVCAEEGRAGWELVEKFDDYRLRFKRPAAARNIPAPAGIDPYRTTYGISQGTQVAIILLCVFGILGILFGVIFAIAH
jgi:hypothetical protein